METILRSCPQISQDTRSLLVAQATTGLSAEQVSGAVKSCRRGKSQGQVQQSLLGQGQSCANMIASVWL